MPTPSRGRSGGSFQHPPPPPPSAATAAATTTTSAQQPTSNSSNINIFDARTADFYHVFSRRKKIILLFFSAAKIFAKKCIRSHSFSAESLALSNKFTCCTKNHLEVVNYCYSQWGWGASTNVDFYGVEETI